MNPATPGRIVTSSTGLFQDPVDRRPADGTGIAWIDRGENLRVWGPKPSVFVVQVQVSIDGSFFVFLE